MEIALKKINLRWQHLVSRNPMFSRIMGFTFLFFLLKGLAWTALILWMLF